MILVGIKEIAISKMKQLFGEDNKRVDHALKVSRFSEEILQGEKFTGKIAETVILTAISPRHWHTRGREKIQFESLECIRKLKALQLQREFYVKWE